MASRDRSMAPSRDSSGAGWGGGPRPAAPEVACLRRASPIDWTIAALTLAEIACASPDPKPGDLPGDNRQTLWTWHLRTYVRRLPTPSVSADGAARSGGDDLDGHRELDVAVELDRDRMGAERLDGLGHVHLPAVELHAGLGLHG